MNTDDIVFVEKVPSMTLISSSREHRNEHLGQLPGCQSKMPDDQDVTPYSTDSGNRSSLPPPQTFHHLSLATDERFQMPQYLVRPPVRQFKSEPIR
jgi:hypothetical protein